MEQLVDAAPVLESKLAKLERDIERVEEEIEEAVRRLKPLE